MDNDFVLIMRSLVCDFPDTVSFKIKIEIIISNLQIIFEPGLFDFFNKKSKIGFEVFKSYSVRNVSLNNNVFHSITFAILVGRAKSGFP